MDIMKVTIESDIPALESAMNLFQAQLIRVALDVCEGSRDRAARALGIHRNSLTRICAKAGIAKGYGTKWYRRA